MKKLVTALILSLTSLSSAYAADSSWNLCSGDVTLFGQPSKLVVNVYEHRNRFGRATDLTVIYGGYVITGSYNSSQDKAPGLVLLKGTQGASSFAGTSLMDYETQTLNLNGSLTLSEVTKVKTSLKCEALSN